MRTAFAVLLLVVFGIKAAVFPLFFWLPDSYPTAPSPITAVFAGLLTKVGVYAIIRTQTLLFPEDSRPATLLLVIAAATMVVGVLGAIAQDDIRRILSFTIVSQIGYMVMGLGFFTVAGVAAVVFSIVHHIVVKTALFLIGGLIEHASGSSRLSRIGGMVRTTPVPRRDVPRLGAQPRRHPAAVGVRLEVRAHRRRHRRRPVRGRRRQPRRQPAHAVLDDQDLDGRVLEPARGRRRGAAAIAAPLEPAAARSSWSLPTAALVACSLAVAAAAGPIYALSERTARDLLDRDALHRRRCSTDEARRPRRRCSSALWLLAWGEVSVANVAQRRRGRGGAARRLPAVDRHDAPARVNPLAPWRGSPATSRSQLVTSNVVMTREILRRRPTIAARACSPTGFAQPSEHVVTLMTSVIALSPGTMTVDVDRDSTHDLRPLPLPPRRRRSPRRRSTGSSGSSSERDRP